MCKICVAYTITDDYTFLTAVSIQSIINNNAKNYLKIYLITDGYFDKNNQKYFDEFKKYKNCEIIWVFVDIEYRSVFDFNLKSSIFNYYNLIEESKVLYLKPHEIVNCDLKDIFEIDLGEYSCAAVENIYNGIITENYNIDRQIFYSNGMTLIDLANWKKQKTYEKIKTEDFKEYIQYTPLNENATFNILINDCKHLDLKYCYAESNYYTKRVGISCSPKTLKEYKLLHSHIESPYLVDYQYGCPMNNDASNNSYSSLWWNYAEDAPVYDDIKSLRVLNKYKLSATSASNSFNYAWLLSRMFPYIRPYIFRIIIGFAISIPLGLLDGVTALALKPYMDYVIGGKTFEFSVLGYNISLTSLIMAFLIPVGIILFAGIQGVLRYLNSYISSWTSMRITNDVKLDLFHRLIHMHPQFFEDNPSGIVISRYVSDPAAASSGIVEQIKNITTSVCGALGLIAVMLYSSWQLAFIGVGVLCAAFVPVTILRKRLRKASNENMVISGNITTNMNETYNGNKVMYAYDLQDYRENDFKTQIKQAFDINISLTKRTAWMSPLMYMIASCGIATVLGVGTYLISIGKMTAGSFASFVTSLLLLYKPVKGLGGTLTGIQQIFVAMGRVFELFDLEPLIKDCANPKEFKELREKITFEDVCFEYVPN
ncbi:hypothetical protein IKE67_06895, partial [bacterium]|nr:hypothetical protein [bacterium]